MSCPGTQLCTSGTRMLGWALQQPLSGGSHRLAFSAKNSRPGVGDRALLSVTSWEPPPPGVTYCSGYRTRDFFQSLPPEDDSALAVSSRAPLPVTAPAALCGRSPDAGGLGAVHGAEGSDFCMSVGLPTGILLMPESSDSFHRLGSQVQSQSWPEAPRAQGPAPAVVPGGWTPACTAPLRAGV